MITITILNSIVGCSNKFCFFVSLNPRLTRGGFVTKVDAAVVDAVPAELMLFELCREVVFELKVEIVVVLPSLFFEVDDTVFITDAVNAPWSLVLLLLLLLLLSLTCCVLEQREVVVAADGGSWWGLDGDIDRVSDDDTLKLNG